MKSTLIYGYGNPGREDDALGILCATEMEKWAQENSFDWLKVETSYQLNIEDAETISNFERVIFVDASQEEIADIEFTEVLPNNAKIEFSMHALSPAYVLHLCHNIFDTGPETHLLHIKGYAWDFKEGLSKKAILNLEKALKSVKERLFDS